MRFVRRPRPELGARFAVGLLAAVLAGVSIDATLGVLFRNGTLPAVSFCVFCVAVLVALQLVCVARPGAVATRGRIAGVLIAQVVLAWGPILVFGPRWHGFTGVFAGSALFLLPAVAGWSVLVATVLVRGLLELPSGAVAVSWAVINTVVAGLVVYGLSRLVRLVAGLHAARHELSRMAVAEERLRFSRDVHELLGLSLSALSVRAELAKRLLADSPERARAELDEVLVISRRALAEVRQVAGGGWCPLLAEPDLEGVLAFPRRAPAPGFGIHQGESEEEPRARPA